MALIHEDAFVENILDDPDELEQVDGGIFHEPEADEDNGNDEPDNENEKTEEVGAELKKKRKASQKPRLNILRLMSENNGLMSVIKIFENVKLKGKGYELDDLNLIMRKMEIWAHRLYPSMQFDDCLAQLEKLGNTRPVATYVTKIRMGLEDTPSRMEENFEGDDSGDEIKNNSTNNDFDRLINSQNRQTSSQTSNTVSSGLTAEQRERMLRNRLIAEQRRLARMKTQQEQLLSKKSSDVTDCKPTVEIPTENVSDKVFDDIVMQDSSICNAALDSNSVEVNEAVDKGITMEYSLKNNVEEAKNNAEVTIGGDTLSSLEPARESYLEIQIDKSSSDLLKEMPVESEDMGL